MPNLTGQISLSAPPGSPIIAGISRVTARMGELTALRPQPTRATSVAVARIREVTRPTWPVIRVR